MKTNIIKTAIFIIAVVITSSLNAQNTKAFKGEKFAVKFRGMVKENLAAIHHSVNNMVQQVKYHPSADFEYRSEFSEADAISFEELEQAARYFPAANADVYSAEMDSETGAILDELKLSAKYYPVTRNEKLETVLNQVTSELAAVVRYYPES